LSATRGPAPGSLTAYATFGIALALEGNYEEAYRYGNLAVRLARRLPPEEARALLCFGGHVSPWRIPISESALFLERAYSRGLESGDLEYAAYALSNLVFAGMFSGQPLDRVLVESESTLAFYRRIHHRSGVAYVLPFVQAARCLKGLTS